ncbi:MAG: hypothetical protein RML46_05595 [Anaerolineae bacterium]|nr:hypothetical protein [Anaerolineae bacterium]
MRIILEWLAGIAWIFYAACGLMALVYFVRALSTGRKLASSITAYEREELREKANRFWRMMFFSLLLGALLFAGVEYLRRIPAMIAGPAPTPTLPPGLVITLSPSPRPPATPIMGALPTITPTLGAPLSPPPVPSPPESPTPSPTATPAGPVPSNLFYARFGDVAELLGYDLTTTTLSPGQNVGVTLYWRALPGAGTLNYQVFVHLLPPDISRMLGQHDGMPVEGTRPTTTWTAGEVLVDFHPVPLVVTDYTGEARIAVGFYDPAAPHIRVPVVGGTDYVLLPVTLQVRGP